MSGWFGGDDRRRGGRPRRAARRPPPGRGRRNGRGRRRGSGENGAAAVLPVALIALLAAAAVAVWWAVPRPTPRDRDTMCPTAGPRSVTAVLIDTTGNFDGLTRADALQEMERLLEESRTDDLFTVYQMRGDLPEEEPEDGGAYRWPLPEPLVTVCNPGNPDEASDLFENREMIRRALEEKYRLPVRELIADLVRPDAMADWSPLMETIQTVQINMLAEHARNGVPRRLVLVTDLIQNSPLLSFSLRRGGGGGDVPDYETFAQTAEARALGADLDGADVEILFVERANHREIGTGSTRDLADWWDRWFTDQGASVSRVKRLSGMS